jgi:hypothetical protein
MQVARRTGRTVGTSLLLAVGSAVAVLLLASSAWAVTPNLSKSPPYRHATTITYTSTIISACALSKAAAPTPANANRTTGVVVFHLCASTLTKGINPFASAYAGFSFRFIEHTNGSRAVSADWSVSASFTSSDAYVTMHLYDTTNGSQVGCAGPPYLLFGSNSTNLTVSYRSQPFNLTKRCTLVGGHAYQLETTLYGSVSAHVLPSVRTAKSDVNLSGTLNRVTVR